MEVYSLQYLYLQMEFYFLDLKLKKLPIYTITRLIITIVIFLYMLFTDKPSVLESMDYRSFGLGLYDFIFTSAGVKEAEVYKPKQPDFLPQKV